MAPPALISRELLLRQLARHLRSPGQKQLCIIGVLAPLAICAWSIYYKFDSQLSYHRLQQCAVWLAAWYTVFSVFCLVSGWLRPRLSDDEADLRHLPLPPTHFLLKRVGELSAVPLICFVLTLPFWLIMLLYTGIPYGQAWMQEDWSWSGTALSVPWLLRLSLATLALLGGVLLPLALGLALSELTPHRAGVFAGMLRGAALLLIVAGAYFVVDRIEVEYLRMTYRQTRGYTMAGFVLPVVLSLGMVFLFGLLPRALRWVGTVLAVLAGAVLMAIPLLPESSISGARSRLEPLGLTDLRFAGGYLAGHLSAPKNVRLALDRTSSNVLIQGRRAVEPQFPPADLSDAQFEAAVVQFEDDYAVYMELQENQPRIPMWFGAAAYPLLLSALLLGGLLLGAAGGRRALREDS